MDVAGQGRIELEVETTDEGFDPELPDTFRGVALNVARQRG